MMQEELTLINRELSLLQFQRRVLAQAENQDLPALERLNYLCIVSGNLDEFFEIRIAGLRSTVEISGREAYVGDYKVGALLDELLIEIRNIINQQYHLLNKEILPELRENGVFILRRHEWNDAQKAWIARFFREEMFPILTPIALDPAHPFPRILNKSLNFVVELEGVDDYGRDSTVAIVQAPRALPRVISLPSDVAGVPHGFVLLSSILHAHVGELFQGMTINGCYQFRLTRNADLLVDDDAIEDLRDALAGELHERKYGDEVRLEVADTCSKEMETFLLHEFDLSPQDVYRVPGMVNLLRLRALYDEVNIGALKFKPSPPSLPSELVSGRDIFSAISQRDILLHHPFQSFAPVIDFVKSAVDDPLVVAIKMTVYRTGEDSVLIEHLIRAARKGKDVTVVLELMARFDEEANIRLAERLEHAGAHVVYGVFGYKTHAKMLLVLRREEEWLKSYVHLGTGNYHPKTTRFYTDMGLLTAHQGIASDVNDVFKQLTSLGRARHLQFLWQAPFNLQPNIIAAIQNEAQNARTGKRARIMAKMNALLEEEIIAELYEASQAGVKIDLIVRGACALRPKVPGLSDNITVISIVGRYLEHHRIMYFYADGEEALFLSSADWMDRNFFRRVEVAFPIFDSRVKRRVIREGLQNYLRDNCESWNMRSDGSYQKKRPRKRKHGAQQYLQEKLQHHEK